MALTAAIVILLTLGTFLMFLAGLGILRMPDVFTRMHASTKGASLGVALLLAGASLHFQDLGITTKAILTIAFVFITAPVAAHVLGRAAYRRGTPLWDHTIIDELKDPPTPRTPPRP